MVRKYLVNRKFDLLAVLSVVMVLFLAGCGGTSSAHASSATTAPLSSHGTTASAVLRHMPEGSATISWDQPSQGLTVKITLNGMAPNSTHPANIQAGSCVKPGAVVHPLQNVVADAHGVGASTTVINKVATLPAAGWYIIVHNGPALAPADQFLPLVCSDLAFTNFSPAKSLSVQVPLNAATGASGTAHLTLSGKTLTVKVTMSGLLPHSSHAAHIHVGSCASQGGVVYTLQNLVANAAGNADATTTIHNVSTIPGHIWYVNVHYGTDMSTQTGFNPVACGDVTVG